MAQALWTLAGLFVGVPLLQPSGNGIEKSFSVSHPSQPLAAGSDSGIEGPGDVPRVVGGDAVNKCGWPTTVSLGGCTGTLVHPQVVVYAAHCGGSPYNAYFGDTAWDSNGFSIEFEHCKVYPNGGIYENDYAYCVLSEPVQGIPITPPLMGQDAVDLLKAGQKVWAVGFGEDENKSTGVKRQVEIPITRFSNGFAYAGGGGKDGCVGDSGGPLFIELPNDRGWRSFGITSHGPYPCGSGGGWAQMHLAMEWLEENSGFDLTPCHDADGTYNPGESCNIGMPLDPKTGGGTGAWPAGCEYGAVTEASDSEACSDAGGDSDSDGVCGDDDNCPTNANTDQGDTNNDGVGDVCELVEDTTYPKPNDSDSCPEGTQFRLEVNSILCVPFCGDSQECPDPITGNVSGSCEDVSKTSSNTDCTIDIGVCADGEVCTLQADAATRLCSFEADLCALTCLSDADICPDLMVCENNRCQYADVETESSSSSSSGGGGGGSSSSSSDPSNIPEPSIEEDKTVGSSFDDPETSVATVATSTDTVETTGTTAVPTETVVTATSPTESVEVLEDTVEPATMTTTVQLSMERDSTQGTPTPTPDGCNCSVPGGGRPASVVWGLVAFFGLAMGRRRREQEMLVE